MRMGIQRREIKDADALISARRWLIICKQFVYIQVQHVNAVLSFSGFWISKLPISVQNAAFIVYLIALKNVFAFF
jgi:hypothetical protein